MLASTIARAEKELGHLWSPKNKVAIEDVKNIRNKVWWRCEKGHDYERTAKNMSTHIRGGYASCPICMNREVLTGFNDLAHKFPELAKEYSPNNDVPISAPAKSFSLLSLVGEVRCADSIAAKTSSTLAFSQLMTTLEST